MVEIIAGVKGAGKTRRMMDSAETAVQSAEGSIIYVDKNDQRMLELNSKIRMINMSLYEITSFDGFLGFLCGALSQNRDIEKIYLDSFLKLAHVENNSELVDAISYLQQLSERFNVDFILSVSRNREDFPEDLQAFVIA